MKKLTVLLCILLATQYTQAQKLTAEEMLTLAACEDYNCITQKITALGYDVASNKEREGYKVYGFKSKATYANESNGKVAKPNTFEYAQRPKDSSVAINYTIGNETVREQLLSEFQQMGFEYIKATKTESVYDNAAVIYESKEHPKLRLKVTNYEKEEMKKKFLEYDFEIVRMTTATKDTTNKNPLRIH